MGDVSVLTGGCSNHVVDTFPDLVEAVRAGLTATLEQNSEFGRRSADDER
jgi:hypothetical protein